MKDWCGTAFCGAFFGGVDSWHVFVCFFRLRWNWLISTISLRILGSFYILGLYPFSSHSVFTPQNGFPPHFWIDQKTRIFLHVHCPTEKHSTGPPRKTTTRHQTTLTSLSLPRTARKALAYRSAPIGWQRGACPTRKTLSICWAKKGVKLRAKGF